MIFIRYKHSRLASMVSAVGAASVVGGFYLLGSALGFAAAEGTGSVLGDVLGGICCLIAGAALMFWAKSIAASKEIKYQEKMKAKTEAKIAAEARGSSVTKKKSGTGKKVGIVLIALQIFVMAFSIYQGNPIWVKAQYQPGASAAGMYLGYFLPAIIGVILIIRGNKKAEVAETVTSSAAEESISPSTGSADATYGFTTRAHICPKCGGNVEDEDNYCIHCGAPIVRR